MPPSAKSVILPGVVIGGGVIISAISLVNKDVPPYTIVGGVPIRVLDVVSEPARGAQCLPHIPTGEQPNTEDSR